MADKTSLNRKNGIFYTPIELASYLAKRLINGYKNNITIFDPAYGDGSLLLAAENEIKKVNNNNSIYEIAGCDIEPHNGKLNHFPLHNFTKQNFFLYPLEYKFDIIIMNPPYVRYHLLNKEKIKSFINNFSFSLKIKSTSDLWLYFLVKAVHHLNHNGSLGALLPWSFIQADYSQHIREWITERFREIKTLALSDSYFNRNNERILLLWLKGYGQNNKSIKIAFSKNIKEKIIYRKINKSEWNKNIICISNVNNIDVILETYQKHYQFNKLEQEAVIKIGIVTGAYKFFILSEDEIQKYRLYENICIPILTTSNQFSGLTLHKNIKLKKLINFRETLTPANETYINEGILKNYHRRSHSLRRKVWYVIDTGNIPDAFFPYRVHKTPYLVKNNLKVQCTNSIHRIYFRNIKDIELQWIQVSLLSIPGQLSIERYSKIYGSGLLKIEPKALKKTIIYKDNNNAIKNIYENISMLLSMNKRNEAADIATRFMAEYMHIPDELMRITKKAYNEIKKRRLERN